MSTEGILIVGNLSMLLYFLLMKRKTAEKGSAMVEAAVVLPFFLGITIISLLLMHFCFKLIQFQHTLAESTRTAFSLKKEERGGATWQGYIERTLLDGTDKCKGTRDLNLKNVEQLPVKFLSANCTGWPCAATAKPGDTFAIEYVVTADILPSRIAGLILPTMQFKSKAVATVFREQDE